jgi:hypothetical protein
MKPGIVDMILRSGIAESSSIPHRRRIPAHQKKYYIGGFSFEKMFQIRSSVSLMVVIAVKLSSQTEEFLFS